MPHILYPMSPDDLPQYWDIEDLIYPGHTIIGIAAESPFYQSLRSVLGIEPNPANLIESNHSKGALLSKLSVSGGHWNRDTILKTYFQEKLTSVIVI